MEQDIKNFDRNIEKLMNEHEVAPPFGMWNRISAELDATPVAATTAPTSVISKRVIGGFIAGVLIMGVTAVTTYLVTTNMNHERDIHPIVTLSPLVKEQAQTASVKQSDPILVKTSPSRQYAVNTPVGSAVRTTITPKEMAPVKENTEANKNQSELTDLTVDVPAPLQPVSQATDVNRTYYFPPVDMNFPEKSPSEKIAHATIKTDDAESDKKGKILTSSEQKIKFHPPKRRKFKYGRIIR
jgi:hypothetical protein